MLWTVVRGKTFFKKKHILKARTKENIGQLFGTDAVVLTSYIENSLIYSTMTWSTVC